MRRVWSWISQCCSSSEWRRAHVEDSNQGGQSADGATLPEPGSGATTPENTTPSITVDGKAPRADPALPNLAPDQFADLSGADPVVVDSRAVGICAAQLARDRLIVIAKCTNRDESPPPIAIQACTELLDRKILEGHERFYMFLDRALAYVAQGDKQHAFDDYNAAVKFAPRKAQPYYYRGIFYAAQSDIDAALLDFDTALGIDPKFVSALRQRAKLYQTRGNFGGALSDHSEAIRLQPKTAALWAERGYVCLRQRDYEGAVKDEVQAIQLDPTLSRAYFLRGAALADLGESRVAASNLVMAVDLDPSLARYVTIGGKTATVALPPL